MSVSGVHTMRAFSSVAGQWSSFGVFLVGVAYGVALIVGFTTRGLSAPIIDPLLAVMEALTSTSMRTGTRGSTWNILRNILSRRM